MSFPDEGLVLIKVLVNAQKLIKVLVSAQKLIKVLVSAKQKLACLKFQLGAACLKLLFVETHTCGRLAKLQKYIY